VTKKTTKKTSTQHSKALSNSSKPARRRKIDPTTCERDYSSDEREFMTAMDDYKRDHGRMFPTCSEILEVVRGLGYIHQDDTSQVERGAGDVMVAEMEMSCTSV
tara:strand:+ start:910 stop:1221 length:312 start_codon:yes stop_codon:yes gene_type:complete